MKKYASSGRKPMEKTGFGKRRGSRKYTSGRARQMANQDPDGKSHGSMLLASGSRQGKLDLVDTFRVSNERERRRCPSCEVRKGEGNQITDEDGGSPHRRSWS
jgi:hypothetical protein